MSELSDFLDRVTAHHESMRAYVDRRFDQILERLPAALRAAGLVFALPTLTRQGVTMAAYELNNDEVLTFRVNAANAEGVSAPLPAGDTFTLVSSDPAKLNAVMGADAAGNVTVSVNALVRAATGITVTLTDSSGLTAATQVFDIVGDAKPVGLTFDMADATETAQDVPPT